MTNSTTIPAKPTRKLVKSHSSWSRVFATLSDLRNDNCLEIGCDASGANVILCCGLQDRLKVALHEAIVRRFTNIFDQVEDKLADLKDSDGNFVFIMADIDYLTLRALSEVLYTGTTSLASEQCKRELFSLLKEDVRLSESWEDSIEDHKRAVYLGKEDLPDESDVKVEEMSSDEDKPLKRKHSSMARPRSRGLGLLQDQKPKPHKEAKPRVDEPKKQHGVRGGSCKFCNKFYDSKTQLNIHERSHTGERPFVCDVCQKAFTSKNNLKMHTESHAGDKPYVCDTCGQAFSRKPYLRQHNKHVHSMGNPAVYSCEMCNVRFVTLGGYDKHMKVHMEAADDPFCELCNKKFKTRKKLYAHKHYVHSTEASYQCATCGSKFKTRTYLKYHEAFHLPESERPFPCTQCDKRFALKKQMCDHVASVHSTEMKFQCDKCSFRTKVKDQLKRHITRKHMENGVKPFKCSYCEHRFVTKKEKDEHERTHTGEKPYECDICQQRFGRKKTLKEHRYTHTGEKPQSCKYCDYRCIQRNDMKKHEKNRHADKLESTASVVTIEAKENKD